MHFRKLCKLIIPHFFRQHLRWFYSSLRRPGCELHPTSDVTKDSVLEPPMQVYPGARIWSSSVGRCSYIGADSLLVAAEVGRFCSIAPRVIVGGGIHPSRNWVSTSPCFYSSRAQAAATFTDLNRIDEVPNTSIGNDVWIGYAAVILPGIQVGNGAIIGAGSVVTKNVADYSVVVGNPGRVARLRFSQEDINWLLQIAWWNWPIEKLKMHAADFSSCALLRSKASS